MRFLLLFFLLCFTTCKKSDSTNALSQIPLETPMVYARYETLPALLRAKPGLCVRAYGYKTPDAYRLAKIMDLCGPVPQKSDTPQKNPWLIQSAVKSFHWEQDLADNQTLQVEIMGSEGVPLPSTATVSKQGTRFLIQVKPTDYLNSNSVYMIVATLFDSAGKKLTSWSVPFKIAGN